MIITLVIIFGTLAIAALICWWIWSRPSPYDNRPILTVNSTLGFEPWSHVEVNGETFRVVEILDAHRMRLEGPTDAS